MAELAPSGGGPNRLFIILAVGLGLLLILGLIGVGGIFLLQRASGPPSVPTPIIAVTTPTRAALAPTITVSPTLGAPTEQATPTFVVVAGGATETPGGSSTPVLGATATTSTGQLPKSGQSEDLLLLAGGVVLVLIVFAARRARFSGRA